MLSQAYSTGFLMLHEHWYILPERLPCAPYHEKFYVVSTQGSKYVSLFTSCTTNNDFHLAGNGLISYYIDVH